MSKNNFFRPNSDDKKALKPYLRVMFRSLSAMFFSLFSFSALGLYLGRLLGHMMLFMIISLFLALTVGFYLVYLELKKLS